MHRVLRLMEPLRADEFVPLGWELPTPSRPPIPPEYQRAEGCGWCGFPGIQVGYWLGTAVFLGHSSDRHCTSGLACLGGLLVRVVGAAAARITNKQRHNGSARWRSRTGGRLRSDGAWTNGWPAAI